MKALHSITYIAVVSVLISCNSPEKKVEKSIEIIKTEATSVDGESKTIASIGIEGMTCAVGCAKRIEKKLNAMEGVSIAAVLFEDKMAQIEFDDAKISEEDMIQLIEELGDYKVTKVEIEKTVVKSSGADEANDKKEIKKETTAERVSHRSISFPNIFDALTRLYRI
jgi:periplasmic mercuric ion binding protein